MFVWKDNFSVIINSGIYYLIVEINDIKYCIKSKRYYFTNVFRDLLNKYGKFKLIDIIPIEDKKAKKYNKLFNESEV